MPDNLNPEDLTPGDLNPKPAIAPADTRPKPQLLPGVAMICLFLIVSLTLNVWAVFSGAYGTGRARIGILAVCTLLAIGIFGLLRLTKWGWALVTAGCVMLATGDLIYFARVHVAFFLVRGLLTLIFFLYLVRPEIRDHLR